MLSGKRLLQHSGLLVFLLLLGTMVGESAAAEYWLWADKTTMTLPGGQAVPAWGFGMDGDGDFNTRDYTITVPGPILELSPGDNVLTVHLRNVLPEPVSLHILGQPLANNQGPVWTEGLSEVVLTGNRRPARNYSARVRSFTHETAPGTDAIYRWRPFRAGTYLLQSGTNPAKQVQMGLFAVVKKDAAAGQTAYAGVRYHKELLLVFHEVDPALQAAIEAGNYGPGADTATGGFTSSVHRTPRFFLINGMAYPDAGLNPINADKTVRAGENVLLRFVNAGLVTHAPQITDLHMTLWAEDGNRYDFPRQQYSIELLPAKTVDAILTPDAGPAFIYDGRLNLSNSGSARPGGMLARLFVRRTLADTLGPLTTDVVVAPSTTGGASQVVLGAVADDFLTGNSYIAGAEWWEGATAPPPGGGTPISGTFAAPTENLQLPINVTGWSQGAHTLSVRSRDSAGNWGVAASVVLNVTQ